MTTKRGLLGQLLMTRELISDADLEKALARQVIQGGRLGSNLVEQASVSIEAVADALSYQIGVPAADLQRVTIDEAVLAAVPAPICDKYRILPLRLQDRTLHLAMQDPWRRDLIEHLSGALRVRIQPYVVPQLRLLYALEKFQGIPRPKRYLREAPAQQARAARDERRKYLEPTVSAPAGTAAGPPPAAAPSTPPHPGADPFNAGAGTSEFQLVFLDDVPRDAPASPKEASQELDIEVSFDAVDAHESRQTVATAQQVIEQLAQSQDREAVVTSLVRPIAADTTLSLLLLPRGAMAVALAASGTELPVEQVRALVVPLSTPSLLQRAVDEKQPACGDAQQDALMSMMSTYLRAPTPTCACVLPVCLADRVVNLLCVQSTTKLSQQRIDELSRIGEAASQAYARLVNLTRA